MIQSIKRQSIRAHQLLELRVCLDALAGIYGAVHHSCLVFSLQET